MRVSIKTKKRRLFVATGDDAVEQEAVEWIQLNGGDFQVVPEEIDSIEGDEEDAWIPDEMRKAPEIPTMQSRSFGFTNRR